MGRRVVRACGSVGAWRGGVHWRSSERDGQVSDRRCKLAVLWSPGLRPGCAATLRYEGLACKTVHTSGFGSVAKRECLRIVLRQRQQVPGLAMACAMPTAAVVESHTSVASKPRWARASRARVGDAEVLERPERRLTTYVTCAGTCRFTAKDRARGPRLPVPGHHPPTAHTVSLKAACPSQRRYRRRCQTADPRRP